MNTTAHTMLLQRRAVLLARSGQSREQFGAVLDALERPAAIADQVRNLAWRIRLRPQWLLVPAAAIAVLRPRKALAWSLRLWGAWKVWRQVMAAVQNR